MVPDVNWVTMGIKDYPNACNPWSISVSIPVFPGFINSEMKLHLTSNTVVPRHGAAGMMWEHNSSRCAAAAQSPQFLPGLLHCPVYMC